MKKINYSIEVSHIYSNERYSGEHQRSIEILKNHWGSIDDKSVQVCLMIDNYNPTEHLLDEDELFAELKKQGLDPDYFAYEADMIVHKDRLLSDIGNNHLRKSYQKYGESRDKMPCSFMTAIWYLVRLGIYENTNIIKPLNGEPFMPSEELINILPERFRAVEMQTQKLLQSVKGYEQAGRIDYLFY